ncbi:uncharacterized protein L969DRAFT_95855 [Mixia osmundae IAM 14324]|uniref:Exocyst complex component SEC5 n=1 Tax=Mixia osmundae (strain CBS 9802 / IAM 14324 / JCM 22182 / KY 12970) TaxID=764103 RepID=G7DSD2_MIXOS|nr:uncharacterized protein L969DRAFT_95855 [Mixia osmundae IAM 14324]KEI38013.1 hypothetical protein L969DRAFT_95855 [Mixia osmundae IAM 14324]GAA93492.1 hypothetical protein E5Q_00133 [Mixia osmundae IAM 14324]
MSRRARDEAALELDNDTLLKVYGLKTAQPSSWQDSISSEAAGPDVVAGTAGSSSRADEPDPLGLRRGSLLSTVPDAPANVKATVLISSKAFDPKTFLATVHPNAAFQDLKEGRERLKGTLEQRSEALRILVEEEFDRFVSIKGSTAAVYDDMRAGLLVDDREYGIRDIKETLRAATSKADQVFMPILDAQLRADRLRSTVGVLERSKFFFNLPGSLLEAIDKGRYDTALLAYRKGLGLRQTAANQLLAPLAGQELTQQQQAQSRRVFDKVWRQVERIITDLRETLTARLRDPKRSTEEIGRTIEMLLELNPEDDPVWIFLDGHYRHINRALQASFDDCSGNFDDALADASKQASPEKALAAELQSSIKIIEAKTSDTALEQAASAQVWKTVFELVKSLSEVLLRYLPGFWKIAKGCADGQYSRSTRNAPARRSPAQARTMTTELIIQYTSSLSSFLSLSSTTSDSQQQRPLPSFVPPNASTLVSGHFMLKTLAELVETTNELGSIGLAPESASSLRELVSATRLRFQNTVSTLWQADAALFAHLEGWQRDPIRPDTMLLMRSLVTFHTATTRIVYRISGASEERATQLFALNSTRPFDGRSNEEPIATDFARRIQTEYTQALLSLLGTIAKTAFAVIGNARDERSRDALQTVMLDEDDRILLTISSLADFQRDSLPRMFDQLRLALASDVSEPRSSVEKLIKELDRALFDDFVTRQADRMTGTVRKGISQVPWQSFQGPAEIHSYVYESLIMLVLTHAQVGRITKTLLPRVMNALVERLAAEYLNSFSKVKSFGTGGMLQATLEAEFSQQVLETYISDRVRATFQQAYTAVSEIYQGPRASSAQLSRMKDILVACKRASALQFLCFRAPIEQIYPQSEAPRVSSNRAPTPISKRAQPVPGRKAGASVDALRSAPYPHTYANSLIRLERICAPDEIKRLCLAPGTPKQEKKRAEPDK